LGFAVVVHSLAMIVIVLRAKELVWDMEVKKGALIIPLPLRNGGTQAAILGLVKKQVDDKTDFLITGLKENIADALFEEMGSLNEESALARHFNIMSAMKVDEALYREKFEDLINQIWLNFFSEMDASHVTEPSGEVSEEIDILSRRVANHYKVLIQETRFRFQTLLKRDVDDHPLMPKFYYKCFWQALETLPLSYEERSFILPLFHRFVMDRYGQILATANRTLIDLKVDITVAP
jgi:hypothetical protein